MDEAGNQQHVGRESLLDLIRRQQEANECWKRAENVVLANVLRSRLEEVGVAMTPDVATALMAAAMLLATASDEWGGDYRDALGDVAAVGLELFDAV